MKNGSETVECVPISELIYLMRTQRHDFINHLQVIMGYLQLNKVDMAIKYIKNTSEELQEAGRLMQTAWPELPIILMLKNRRVKEELGEVKVALHNVDKIDKKPPIELTEVIGEVYEIICRQMAGCPLDGQQLSVDIDETNGTYVLHFTWPQGEKAFDKIGFLTDPVMEEARKSFPKVELFEQGEELRLLMYLPVK